MALRIVKASDPIQVDRINLCIYAPPGVGKTTLAQTAADPLTLDFDEGETFTDAKPIDVKAGKVDGKKIKADTFYALRDGKFVEANS